MAKEGLLTADEVAQYLQCSVSWVRRLAARGQIPHYRLGGLVRFRHSEVERWLAEHHYGGGHPQSRRDDPNQLTLFGQDNTPL
ncbi:MAG: helix-turn-helix domain-containing protein [Candidatus Latescibacteria bacterium]|nr:helix-turn-helix domain-containing protein [Candidatus Latescibacterota bacterium]